MGFLVFLAFFFGGVLFFMYVMVYLVSLIFFVFKLFVCYGVSALLKKNKLCLFVFWLKTYQKPQISW